MENSDSKKYDAIDHISVRKIWPENPPKFLNRPTWAQQIACKPYTIVN